MKINAPNFFLGANSCEGFVSHFRDCFENADGWRAILIKGGPGTGKSSLMRYVAASASERGLAPTLCPCSSDPDSLDGVIIGEKRVALLDATAPHTVDPKLPGACEEILNLGQFWNSELLYENAAAIRAVTNQNSRLHKTAARYLSAAGETMFDNLRLQHTCIDYGRLSTFAARLCDRLLPPPSGKTGREQIRFAEGITPRGVVCFPESVTDYYGDVFIIDDKIGGVSTEICDTFRTRAREAGLDIITLKSPFLPSALCDGVLIPELSLAVVREDEFMRFNTDARRIHTRRFTCLAALKAHRNRMIFNRRITRELLNTAADTLGDAKAVHDQLERFYIAAMDFSAMAREIETLTERILS